MALALLLSTGATHVVLAQRMRDQTQTDLLHERDEFRSVLAAQLATRSDPQPGTMPGPGIPAPDLASVSAGVLAAATSRAVPERDVVFLGLLDGRIVARSGGPAPMDLATDSSLVAEWARAATTLTAGATTTAGPVSYLAEPFSVPGDPHRGVFVAAIFTESESAALSRMTTLQIELGVLALVLGGGVAWLVAGRVLRPIQQITVLARRITGRDLSERIPVVGRDEVSDLASTFNTMLDRLQAVIERQKELLADVSHELRTPITVVQGNLDTLDPATPEDATSITIATDELTRMTRMVEDLLVLGRSEQPGFARRRPVDVDDLINDLADKLRSLDARRWVVTSHAHGTALLDRDLVTQAVMELGLNAVRHAPGPEPLGLSSGVDGRTLSICVKDQGPGIPDPDKPRVFQRFVRLGYRRTTGSGLGLAITRVIARAHGGDAIVRNRDGRPGSCFELRLPVMIGTPSPAPALRRGQHDHRGTRGTRGTQGDAR